MSDYWAEQEYTCAPTDPNPIDTEALRREALGQLGLIAADPRWPGRVLALLDQLAAAEHRATRAESDRDEWKEVALQERGAALDALEQIKAREARIKAVQALTDQADAAVEPGGDPRYSEGPMLTTARIRRALEE